MSQQVTQDPLSHTLLPDRATNGTNRNMVLMDGSHGLRHAHGHLWSVITTASMETLWFLCVNSLPRVAKAPGDLGQSLRKGTIAKPRYHMVPREVL